MRVEERGIRTKGRAARAAALLVAACALNYVLDDWPTSLLWPALQRAASNAVGDSFGNLIRNLAPMTLALVGRIMVVLWAAKGLSLSTDDLGWRRPLRPAWVATAVVGAVLVTALNSWGTHLIGPVISHARLPTRLWIAPEDLWANLAVPWVVNHFVFYWLTSALGEELFYRGLLHGGLQKYLSPARTIAVTSIVFSLNHFHFSHGAPFTSAAFADHLLVGVFLGCLREREGTLWAPLAGHAALQVCATWFDWFAAFQ